MTQAVCTMSLVPPVATRALLDAAPRSTPKANGAAAALRADSARTLDQLALQAQRGEPGALERLLKRLHARLRPLVRHHLLVKSGDVHTTTDVDDVLQDLVLLIWQQDLARFDPKRSAFLTFVSRRMRWHLIDRTRRARRRATSCMPASDLDRLEDAKFHPEVLLEAKRTERLLRMLPSTVEQASVDDRARHTVQRHDLEGASLTDVARELEVHVSNACRARQRALKHLARHLAPLAA